MAPGATLSHYRIVELLGNGGKGEVYLAEDMRDQSRVALRILPAPVEIPNFEHPSVAGVLGAGESGGACFLASEYVEGETLAHRIREGNLDPASSLKIAFRLAKTLAAAHAAGAVHGSLSPANIVAAPKVKLLDFGLEGPPVSPYRSPEQLLGSPASPAGDIFSLGAVMYEMATWKPAFAGATEAALRTAILESTPPWPDDVDKRFAGIADQALNKSPELRYPNAEALVEDLKALRFDPTPAATEEPPQPRRWKPLDVGGAMGLAAAAVILLWFSFARQSGEEPIGPAEVSPLTAYAGLESGPALSPDGNQVAFSWEGLGRDNFDIYIKNLPAGLPIRLTTSRARDYSPAWSPDGQSLAFLRQTAADESELLVIAASGGAETKLTAVALAESSVVWFSGGRWLAVVDREAPGAPTAIFRVPRAAGARQKVTDPPANSGGDRSPSVSPGGSSLAYIRELAPPLAEIETLALSADGQAAGAPRRVGQAANSSGLAWSSGGARLVYSSGWFGAGGLWQVSAAARRQPAERVLAAGDQATAFAAAGNRWRAAFTREIIETNLWRMDFGAGQPRLVAGSIGLDRSPAISPDGRRIAFVSTRSGAAELWTCDASGSKPAQLSSLAATEIGQPLWSPGGNAIAFSTAVAGNEDVYTIPAAGGKLSRITMETSHDANPSWSRDGRTLYFDSSRDGSRRVWQTPAAGGADAAPVSAGTGSFPLESFDGKFLYYIRAQALVRAPIAGGPPETLVPRVQHWAQAGGGIFFTEPADPLQLRFLNAATGESRAVARFEKPPERFSVSRDGAWMVYAQIDRHESDLMLLDNFR